MEPINCPPRIDQAVAGRVLDLGGKGLVYGADADPHIPTSAPDGDQGAVHCMEWVIDDSLDLVLHGTVKVQ
jgi:hypothetical protein